MNIKMKRIKKDTTRQEIYYKGVLYLSINEYARMNDIPLSNVIRNRKEGRPLDYRRPIDKVVYNGVEYKSVYHFSEKKRLNYGTVKYRHANGLDLMTGKKIINQQQ